MTEKTILGIDPGTNVMGYGLLHVRGNKAELVVMGVVDMRRESDPYVRLGRIYERVTSIIDAYHPDELAIEAPFFGKNVQSMLKLGRAQGVAIAAAIRQGVPIHEYAPLKIKMAITGNGSASKEQVAAMLQRLLSLRDDQKPHFMDATDALATVGRGFTHVFLFNFWMQNYKKMFEQWSNRPESSWQQSKRSPSPYSLPLTRRWFFSAKSFHEL